MRKEFTITQEQADVIHAANNMTHDRDENHGLCNDAWIALGKELGFDGMTARPMNGNYDDLLHFTAEELEDA